MQGMNLKEELLKELSHYNIDRVVSYIGDRPSLFAHLFEILETADKSLSPRVAWATAICLDNNPGLGIPYQKRMVELLRNPAHTSLIRTVLRYFSQIDLEEELQGELYEKSFHYLLDAKFPAAPRVYAMQIMYNIGLHNPELLNELKLILDEVLPLSDGGVLNRGTKLLKEINSKKP
jgi:hypothetical protein